MYECKNVRKSKNVNNVGILGLIKVQECKNVRMLECTKVKEFKNEGM